MKVLVFFQIFSILCSNQLEMDYVTDLAINKKRKIDEIDTEEDKTKQFCTELHNKMHNAKDAFNWDDFYKYQHSEIFYSIEDNERDNNLILGIFEEDENSSKTRFYEYVSDKAKKFIDEYCCDTDNTVLLENDNLSPGYKNKNLNVLDSEEIEKEKIKTREITLKSLEKEPKNKKIMGDIHKNTFFDDFQPTKNIEKEQIFDLIAADFKIIYKQLSYLIIKECEIGLFKKKLSDIQKILKARAKLFVFKNIAISLQDIYNAIILIDTNGALIFFCNEILVLFENRSKFFKSENPFHNKIHSHYFYLLIFCIRKINSIFTPFLCYKNESEIPIDEYSTNENLKTIAKTILLIRYLIFNLTFTRNICADIGLNAYKYIITNYKTFICEAFLNSERSKNTKILFDRIKQIFIRICMQNECLYALDKQYKKLYKIYQNSFIIYFFTLKLGL